MSHRKRKDEKCEPSLSSKKMNKRVLSLSSEENSHVSSPVGLALFPFCPRRSGILEESYSFEVKEKERITAVHGEKKKNKTLTGTLVKQNRGEKLVGLHGTNWGEGTESKARCQYLIGISDPATGVVKLHSVDHVFALAMQVLGGGNDDESNVKLGESVRGDRERNALVMEFGSKVKKNAVKSSELNLIRDESIAGRDALHSALKQEMESPQAALNRISSTNEEALQGDKKLQDQLDAVKRGEEEGRRAFLPSYTADANTPQEVYSVTSIVPCAAEKELLRLLEDHHEACRRNVDNVWTWGWLGVENMPQYVTSRLDGLKDDPSSRLYIAHLLFLRAMIALANAPALLKNKNTENVALHVINAPEVVAHHLLANFYQQNTKGEGISNYIRTNSLRDKLYVHTLCLAVILEPGCKLKLDTISSDLGISVQRAQQLIKELGCKVKGDTAMLTVPLVFPTRRRINRR